MKRFSACVLLLIIGVLLGLGTYKPEKLNSHSVPSNLTDPFLKIDVYYTPTEQVLSMDLETYIKGVVASEMPVSADVEALKAQAVAARTVAVRKMRALGGTSSRPDADVTSDYRTDQAYNPESVIKERWGAIAFWLNWPKIEQAVNETKGLILTHNGVPCDVVYHSTCGGETEAAADVWGREVPYLKSVPCGFCTGSPHYKGSSVEVPLSSLAGAFANLGLTVPVTFTGQDVVRASQISPTGRVKQVVMGGQAVRGLEFRTALGLKSTLMSWKVSGDSLVFQVRGYGHGAGMCQYGACGMAKEGKLYTEILAHYYPGTKVVYIFEE